MRKLTINFSEVWPRQILDLGKQFNLMIPLENVLKTSLQYLQMLLQDVFKTFWRRLEDVLKTSWRHLEGLWPRRIYFSWLRRLLKTRTRDIFKTSSSRRMLAGNGHLFVLELCFSACAKFNPFKTEADII